MLDPDLIDIYRAHMPQQVEIDPQSGYAINVPAALQEPVNWWRDQPDAFKRIKRLREQMKIKVNDFPFGEPTAEDLEPPQTESPLMRFEREQAELRGIDPEQALRRDAARRAKVEAAETEWWARRQPVPVAAGSSGSPRNEQERSADAEAEPERRSVRRRPEGDR